jgi:hypothetical protein
VPLGPHSASPSLGVGGSLGGASPPQLSLSSPRLELPGGSLGPQISVDRYTHDGVNLTTAEVGSRYFTDIAPGLELGVGPGVGYTWSDADAGKAADLWGLQVGADIHYRQGSLSMGLDTRYRWSEDQALGTGGPVPDSWLTRLNLGVSF